MKKGTTAVGGTFDLLHRGHEAIILEAFHYSRNVIMGVTSDRFVEAERKVGVAPFTERRRRVLDFLASKGLVDRAKVVKLEDSFGPILEAEITDIVVTKETRDAALEANRLRADRGIAPLKIHEVQIVLAKDGAPISSSRIREGEIDVNGNPIPS